MEEREKRLTAKLLATEGIEREMLEKVSWDIKQWTVTLGLSCNWSVGRIKGNQATFDNSQRNNLRSCVWVRW